MIRTIFAKGFTAVPWLETAALMTTHPDGIAFSTEKPNVIVGPNGAGKSALLRAMSLLTLSAQTGMSGLERKYLGDLREDKLWARGDYDWERRQHEHIYLP